MDPKWYNLQIDDDLKAKFASAADAKGYTMKTVLISFIKAYVENPDRFEIKMEVPQ